MITAINYTYTGYLLTGISYPDGKKAVIAYSSNKPASVTLRDASGAQVYKVAYSFSGNRLYSVTEYGADNSIGAKSTYSYSVASARTLVTTTEQKDTDEGETANNVITTTYTFDDLSRIIEEKALANSTKMCYTYDSLSRVTARTVKKLSDNSVVSSETFNYDAAGNVTSAPDSCFAYDTNNRLTAFNGNTVSYDLDGNMLNNGATSFTYDSANRLVSAGGHTYTYNAEDVRIRNLCSEEDTTYTYNTNAKLSMLLMKTTNGVATKYVYGRGLIGEEVSSAFKTYHFDCRGSIVMLNTIFIIMGVILNVICIWSIKIMLKDKLTWKGYLKYMMGILVGAVLSFLLFPITISSVLLFALMGGTAGELLSLFFLAVKQAYKKDSVISYYDDGTPAKFFITGDKHRQFDRVKAFCRDMNTRRKDVLIILGDTGFNFYDDKRDDELKREISVLNITLFCLHGNKENRPQNVGTYGIRSFCGGKVYYEPKYPNIYFAIDGEMYTFEGKKYMVVGGAHSVDKMRCIEGGTPFWDDEMPNDTIKETVERNLQNEGNKIFGMLTHTCPIDYLPTEMFMTTSQNACIKRKPRKAKSKKLFKPDIDRSTEIWLGDLEKKIDYEVWFCGHYHIDKQIDKIQMMCHDIHPLHMQLVGDESCPS